MLVWAALAALGTFVIAAVAVGSVTGDYLADKGVASAKTADEIGSGLVVVTDDEPLAYVLGRCEATSLDVSDAAVATILEVERGYYEAIGAIGPQVTGPDDPVAAGADGPSAAPTMTSTPAEPDETVQTDETATEGTE